MKVEAEAEVRVRDVSKKWRFKALLDWAEGRMRADVYNSLQSRILEYPDCAKSASFLPESNLVETMVVRTASECGIVVCRS